MNKLFIILGLFVIVFSVGVFGDATGCTITYDGLYTVHTCSANDTFIISAGSYTVDYLIVAGGGAGGGSLSQGGDQGGGAGGGAGGLNYSTSVTLTSGSYPVIVGHGGWNGTTVTTCNGTNSSFNGVVMRGGGCGAQYTGLSGIGGSGGGGSGSSGKNSSGISGQGNSGGDGANFGAGGGGGANNTGGLGTSTNGGAGGNGKNYSINGSNVYYAGGGGGGEYGGVGGSGGLGGGGYALNSTGDGGFGVNGTGGGGGGYSGKTGINKYGGSGGSGIVIIRYFTSTLISYAIQGNVTYNNSGVPNANISLLDGTSSVIISTTTSNSSGAYYFNNYTLSNSTYYMLLAYNSSKVYTSSSFVYVNGSNGKNVTYKNLDFLNSGGSSTTIYPACFIFQNGCYATSTLLSNGCSVVSR